MAWTVTKTIHTVFGDKRVHGFDLSSDAATVEIDSGLEHIDHIQWSVKSANSFGPYFSKNTLSAATVSYGHFAITGCTSGDTFYVTIYGR